MASRTTRTGQLVARKSSGRKRANCIGVAIRVTYQGIPSVHQLPKLPVHTKIAAVKVAIEHHLGIPPETYYLTYLDAAPLDGHRTLSELDAIDGCTFDLRTWKLWADLMEACHCNSTERCLAYPGICGTTEWNKRCAWSALFMAAHRGYYLLVSNILEHTSVDINRQSASGWTALHAAARAGAWKALCVLINNGADVRVTDGNGRTAFDLAREFGNKKCEDTLGFCQWSLQKYKIVQDRKSEYSAAKAREAASRQGYQFSDSTLKTWLGGPRGELYMSQIPNPVTLRVVAQFEEDTRTKNTAVPVTKTAARTEESSAVDGGDEEEKSIDRSKTNFHYGWFDPLRAHHFIPSTNDILNYADPSSFQLRPRSILNPRGYQVTRLTNAQRPLRPLGPRAKNSEVTRTSPQTIPTRSANTILSST